MQLMIRPSLACQYKCDFCSIGGLHQPVISKEYLNSFIQQIKIINPDNVIITGGDPLLLPVSFFEDILKINERISISLTTNLYDFTCNPNKWVQLFKNKRVGISTSFQYGSKRKMPSGEVYSEEEFIKTVNQFNDLIGYKPSFIAVIDQENKDRAIDHVRLAKKINTTCKLNSMLPAGKSNEYFPRYELLKIYNQIIDCGLEAFEENTKDRFFGNCPFNTCLKCQSLNRAVRIVNQKPEYSFCEDLLYNEILSTTNYDLLDQLMPTSVPTKCLCCQANHICNSCYMHRYFLHQKNFATAKYCVEMKEIFHNLKNKGFKI